MEKILGRILAKLGITPDELHDEMDAMSQKYYEQFLGVNNLSREQLWYWSDSAYTPIYMFEGTEQELDALNPPADCVFSKEEVTSGEYRWMLSYMGQMFDIPVSVVLMYFDLASNLPSSMHPQRDTSKLEEQFK